MSIANEWIEELKHITIIRNKCDDINSAIEKFAVQRKYINYSQTNNSQSA